MRLPRLRPASAAGRSSTAASTTPKPDGPSCGCAAAAANGSSRAARPSSEYAREWLERQTCASARVEIYSWALRQHLIPYFGRRRLDQITVDDIAAFIAAMRRKGLKGWTITERAAAASNILAQAARSGRIPRQPVSQLERGERPKPRRPTAKADPHPRRDASTDRPRRQRAVPLPARTAAHRRAADRRSARARRRRPRPRARADPGRVPTRPRRQPHTAQDRGVATRDRHPAAADAPAPRTRRRHAAASSTPTAFVFASRNGTRPRTQGRTRSTQARRQGRRARQPRADACTTSATATPAC